MSDLTLYYAVPSRGTVVRWLLEELGVSYNVKLLNLDAEEHKSADYLKINPMGKVPTLVHGDRVVTETPAICMYLAETFTPAPPTSALAIAPEEAERAAYLRWMFYAPVSAEPAVLWTALNGQVDGDYRPFADIQNVADTLRDWLEHRTFMVGDRFTAADVMIGGAVFWGLHLMPVLPRHQALVDYWARLAERPAWQRTLALDAAESA